MRVPDVAAGIIRESAKAVNPGVLAAIIKWQLDLGNEEYSRQPFRHFLFSQLALGIGMPLAKQRVSA